MKRALWITARSRSPCCCSRRSAGSPVGRASRTAPAARAARAATAPRARRRRASRRLAPARRSRRGAGAVTRTADTCPPHRRLLRPVRASESDTIQTPVWREREVKAMSPLKKSNNIAARMGRWSASHWKTAVFGWLAFVVVAARDRHGRRHRRTSTRTTRTSASRTAPTTSSRDAGFQADPQTEIVARPEQERSPSRTRRSARPSPTPSHAVAAVHDDQEPALAARPGARRPDLGRRAHRAWSSST